MKLSTISPSPLKHRQIDIAIQLITTILSQRTQYRYKILPYDSEEQPGRNVGKLDPVSVVCRSPRPGVRKSCMIEMIWSSYCVLAHRRSW
jgi:hypothetical protein